MPFSNIDKPSKYFNTVLYTGNGSTQSITGVGFKPDLVWIKSRSNTFTHLWYDIIRGAGKYLQSPSTGVEGGASGDLLGSFDTDGFQVNNTLTPSTNPSTNGTSSTFVAWNWLGANTTVSNTSGSITSTVSANTTSGFSIVSYTGTGANATVGHSLGTTPAMIIIKARSTTGSWVVNHKGLANQTVAHLTLETTNASADNSTLFNSTAPTSSVFSIGANTATNTSSATYIAYCFAEVKGFSKFGSYIGNGSANGTFVYTGFKPAWVLWKNTTTAGTNWVLMDNKRNTYNPENLSIAPNTSDAEADFSSFPNDFLSNGFKLRNTGAGVNASGSTYIYMAFADNPFVSSKGIPTTAR